MKSFCILRRSLPCSLTIEAAFSLSLFLFCTAALLTPMLVLKQQIYASRILEESARTLSRMKYIEYRERKAKRLLIDKESLGDMEAALHSLLLTEKLKDHGLRRPDLISESEISESNIYYALNFEAVLPLPFPGLLTLPQQVVASRRSWIGADGYRFGDAGDGEKDELVYVSILRDQVYHLFADCSYIANEFYSSPPSFIHGQPAKYGGFFSPCQSCRPSSADPLVYYTEGGKRYHKSTGCRAMQSFVRSCPLTEALEEGRHLCSRCTAHSIP